MLLSSIPAKIVEAFAINGTKNTIPVASQIGITPGAASFNDGFPPLTATPLAAGGVPPSVGDMNGILNAISAWVSWMSAGGTVQYDGTFSTAVGGYPKNAVVASTTAGLLWMNTADNNTTNPDSGGSNWVAIQAGGSFLGTIAAKSAAYTITSSDNGALIVAGAYAMTLPSAPATAFRVTILSSATGTTIVPNGNTVNLAAGATSSTISLPAAGDFVTLVWDGSVWRVVGGSAAMLNAYVKGAVKNTAPIAVGASSGSNASATSATFTAPSAGNLIMMLIGTSSNGTAGGVSVSTSLAGLVALASNASNYEFTDYAYLPMTLGQSTTITGAVSAGSGNTSFNLIAFFQPAG